MGYNAGVARSEDVARMGGWLGRGMGPGVGSFGYSTGSWLLDIRG